jgi:poly(A) polymerase
LRELVAQERAQNVAPDAMRRLAALLPADSRIADQTAARLRLSTAQRKRLVAAAGRTGDLGTARALAYRLGRDEAVDRLLIMGSDISPLDDWEIPTFPLKGGEIVARGVSAGPEVARVLQAVETRWVGAGFPNKAEVVKMLDEELAQ